MNYQTICFLLFHQLRVQQQWVTYLIKYHRQTIYLVEGEEYKVNLDSIFSEITDNTYSFVSENKGFILDTSNLKLKSDQGKYSICIIIFF